MPKLTPCTISTREKGINLSHAPYSAGYVIVLIWNSLSFSGRFSAWGINLVKNFHSKEGELRTLLTLYRECANELIWLWYCSFIDCVSLFMADLLYKV
jgi:hypothetical protein